MSSRWTRWWRFIGPCLLVAVFWWVGPAKWWAAVRGADGLWFAAACALAVPMLAIRALRWQRIVRLQGLRMSLRESAGLYAAGMLAGAVTPGKVGDLAKVPYLVSRGAGVGSSLGVSLLDRGLDGGVLILAGAISVLCNPELPREVSAGVAAALVVLAAALAALLASPRVLLGLATLPRTPAFVGRLAEAASAAREALRNAGLRWWSVVTLATLAACVPYYAAAACCAQALGLPLGALDLVTGVSAAAVLAMVPVTVAGIGTRDAVFVMIFSRRGLGEDQALAFASIILASMAVNCVVLYVISRICLRDSTSKEGERDDGAA